MKETIASIFDAFWGGRRDGRPIRVGFWRSSSEPWLPDPRTMVDERWNPAEREVVLRHIRTARRHEAYFGQSTCRFCGIENGCDDLTDGTYVWPSGLGHYVEAHAVRLPEEFVRHVLARRR